jgi:hypothetical protein
MYSKNPSMKYIKEDFDEFVPMDFKKTMLAMDSSYEEEEENPLKLLEEEEAKEFYNMVRSIFNSANINLKNEQLYSPLLEALIKNYSKRLSNKERFKTGHGVRPIHEKGGNLTDRDHLYHNKSPVERHQPTQIKLLDMNSLSSLGKGWSNRIKVTLF